MLLIQKHVINAITTNVGKGNLVNRTNILLLGQKVPITFCVIDKQFSISRDMIIENKNRHIIFLSQQMI